jgi:tRNA pseudouridine65 synthase
MEVIFQDASLILVNKPPGVLIHRTGLDTRETYFLLQEVRNMVGGHVYPVHRLDRKTSGIILFAKSGAVSALLNSQFRDHQVKKIYLAIVRGHTPDEGTIDYPLKDEKERLKEAITHFTTIKRSEIPVSSGRFATSRYSLVSLKPVTGRMHQLRRHMSHIFHPIIGDRPHGCNKQNRFFKECFGLDQMLLHASEIQFLHPETNCPTSYSASLPSEFVRISTLLSLDQ